MCAFIKWSLRIRWRRLIHFILTSQIMTILIFYAGRFRNLLFLNNMSKLFIWLIYMSLNLIGRRFNNNYELLVCAAERYCKFNKCISEKNTTRYFYLLIYILSAEHTSIKRRNWIHLQCIVVKLKRYSVSYGVYTFTASPLQPHM